MIRDYLVEAMIDYELIYRNQSIDPVVRSESFSLLGDAYNTATDEEREAYKEGVSNDAKLQGQ